MMAVEHQTRFMPLTVAEIVVQPNRGVLRRQLKVSSVEESLL